MKEKRCLDALSITGIIIPTVTLMILRVQPASPARAQPLGSRPSLASLLCSPLPMPCVREYENPYNETILSDGKKSLLELHLLQRRLNYMSNCDNFPSIHSPF